MSDITLGLDLGPSSIGWAVIDEANPRIIPTVEGTPGCGVRHFQESVNPKNKSTLASERGKERRARRNRHRRKQRTQKLRRTLIRAGLYPDDPAQALGIDDFLKDQPCVQPRFALYKLRVDALQRPLNRYEFGRLLLHLNQRRGFRSNRRRERTKEDGKINKAMGDFERSLRDNGSRSVGEHLFRIATGEISFPQKLPKRFVDPNTIRGRVIKRAQVEEEFGLIWNEQEKHISELRTDGLRERVRRIIFDQRPLKSAKRSIGRCECIPRLRRCPRANWYAQHWRILKEVNNLRIHNSDGTTQELTPKQRKQLLNELSVRDKLTFDEMRAMPEFKLIESQLFNLEEGPGAQQRMRAARRSKGKPTTEQRTGRASLKGNLIDAALVKAFGIDRWADFDEDRKKRIRETFISEDDPDKFAAIAQNDEWALSKKSAESLADASLPEGYMRYSLEALKAMIGKFEAGLATEKGIKEYDAQEQCGFNNLDGSTVFSYLPKPLKPDGTPLTTNPMVRQALWQVRKEVNAIIAEYGKPARVVVEIVREMKRSLAERWDSVEQQNENAKDKEQIRNLLRKEFEVSSPSGDDVLAYRLWKQQGFHSPYSGKPICSTEMRAFFNRANNLQIDHIIPRNKWPDDTASNKCLCFADENQKKIGLTPREWLGEGTPEYETMLKAVTRMKETGMPWSKRRKFTLKDVTLDEFTRRQLNDTAYIAREVRKYLQCLYPPDRRESAVVTTPGGVTKQLRWQWGLDSILDPEGRDEKNRLDLRHHAIDAIVVALTNQKHIHALSQEKRRRRSENWKNEPWGNFRADVESAVRSIVVSHRTSGRVAEALHDDTLYATTEQADHFAYRKPLSALARSEVKHIRDLTIRRAVLKRVGASQEESFQEDQDESDESAKPSKKVPANVWSEPLRLRNRRSGKATVPSIVKSVRLMKRDETIRPIRKGTAWIKTGRNHHLWFGETTSAEGKPNWECEAITMLEAAERVARGEPLIQKEHPKHPGAKFLMALSKGDLLLLRINGEDRVYRYETAPSTSKQMVFRLHSAAAVEKNGKLTKYPSTLRMCNPRKVTVDPLGRIRWADGFGAATAGDAVIDPRVLDLAREVVSAGDKNSQAFKRLKRSPFKHLGAQLTRALRQLRTE